jgi:hypothetical protein
VLITSQASKQNAFEVMMGEAYKGNNVFNCYINNNFISFFGYYFFYCT